MRERAGSSAVTVVFGHQLDVVLAVEGLRMDVGLLALASPLFPKTTVHLRGGDLAITAPRAARDAPLVQRLELDGETWEKPWLRLHQVADGGRLAFDLDRAPNRRWGSDPSAAPPSFGPRDAASCVSRPG